MKFLKYFENIVYTKQTDFHKKNGLWMAAPFGVEPFVDFLDSFDDKNINNFIELGFGDLSKSILASKKFKHVYSMEIYKPYYDEGIDKVNKDNIYNIDLINGDILKDYNKLPVDKSVVYSFLPFGDEERLNNMVNIYVNYFPMGSYFYFPGIKINNPNLKKIELSFRWPMYLKT